MFLKDQNGNKLPVNLRAGDSSASQVVEKYEKPEGSNKMLLYIALLVGLAVAIGSGYLLLKEGDNKAGNKKTLASRENFGYRI